MSLLDDKLAQVQAMREQKPKPEKPRYRVRNGKIVMRLYAVLAEKKPASNIREIASKLPKESKRHTVGGRCPHCKGTGSYTWHLYEHKEKCFRCHGKGFLSQRDIQFYNNRLGGAGPICDVESAS